MSFQLCRNVGRFAQYAALRNRGTRVPLNLTPNKPLFAVITNTHLQSYVFISTSKKNRDTDGTTVEPGALQPSSNVDPGNVTGKKKYWKSLGFNWTDQETDQNDANWVMFVTVTIGVVLLGFIFAYYPDVHLQDWGQREAYIELARREALGLPHIDPNLVPPEKVNLPSEEELEDFEIII